MKPKHLIYTITVAISIISVSLVILFLARGYRLDLPNQDIHGTGIITVHSTPDDAIIYINGVPKNATDSSIPNLKPGNYRVRLEKEGYAVWEKEVEVEKELVTRVSAVLIPLYPSLEPLTHTGVQSPLLSPDRQKLVFKVAQENSAGIWLLELEEQPFNLTQKPRLILSDTTDLPYSKTSLSWAPDSSAILVEFTGNNPSLKPRLYNLTDSSVTTLNSKQNLLEQWKEFEVAANKKRVTGLPQDVVAKIRSLPNAHWSPDNNYILYSKDTNSTTDYYLYPVPQIGQTTQQSNLNKPQISKDAVLKLPNRSQHRVEWFSDSRHLLIIKQSSGDSGSIEIIGLEGNNRTDIFSGNLKGLSVFPNPSGSKIIALTKFNPAAFNLYAINLR